MEVFELYSGTYEEYLIGFTLKKNDSDYVLEHTVADHSHKASVRCISCCRNLLATGSADELIHLYNVDGKRETGILSQHTGTVTCVAFTPDGKHLLSTSEDGSIIVYRVGSWMVEKIWNKAHRGTVVNWISVHPSNKLALSAGNDGKIRTWNLMDGTEAFSTDVSKRCRRPELVIWAPRGETYALVCGNSLEVYKISDASLQHIVRMSSKIPTVAYLNDDIIVVGDSSGVLEAHQISSGDQLWRHCAGEARIKAMIAHENFLVTATSLGVLSVLEWTKKGVKEICSHDTSCRITCLTLSCKCHRPSAKGKKKKGKIEDSFVKKEKEIGGNEVSEESNVSKKNPRKSWNRGSWTVEDLT